MKKAESTMDMINNIIEKVKEKFADSKGSHDWEHIQRVFNLALHIGTKENANLTIIGYAAILHDIGRVYQDATNGKICHAQKGAVLAEKMLHQYNLLPDQIDAIIHCIETHSYRGSKKPESIEAKVLFDADKLDSIGAVGVGRAFLFAGEIGAKLHNKNIDIENTRSYSKEDTAYREYLVKLKYVKDCMLTSEGKKIAEGRHLFMVSFFEQLNEEVMGNR
jgi:uncharacterized protein